MLQVYQLELRTTKCNLFRFILQLALARETAGIQPPLQKRRRYVTLQKTILKVTQEYNVRTTMKFVEGIASNIVFH